MKVFLNFMGTTKESTKKKFTYLLLESLLELGGAAKIPVIMDKMYKKIGSTLSATDLEKLPKRSEIRWQNRVAWIRADLITREYLKKGSPRGLWEITNEGKTYFMHLKNLNAAQRTTEK
jgi:hypothetical protein